MRVKWTPLYILLQRGIKSFTDFEKIKIFLFIRRYFKLIYKYQRIYHRFPLINASDLRRTGARNSAGTFFLFFMRNLHFKNIHFFFSKYKRQNVTSSHQDIITCEIKKVNFKHFSIEENSVYIYFLNKFQKWFESVPRGCQSAIDSFDKR